MIDSGLDQLQLRADAPFHLGLGCQSINHTEREEIDKTEKKLKGGVEKIREKKRQALQEDAAKCVKITQMFAGYGGASSGEFELQMTKTKASGECPICGGKLRALSKHLRLTHGLLNTKERSILDNLATGRVTVEPGPCPFPLCSPHILHLEKHIRRHQDVTRERVAKEIKALKPAAAIRQCGPDWSFHSYPALLRAFGLAPTTIILYVGQAISFVEYVRDIQPKYSRMSTQKVTMIFKELKKLYKDLGRTVLSHQFMVKQQKGQTLVAKADLAKCQALAKAKIPSLLDDTEQAPRKTQRPAQIYLEPEEYGWFTQWLRLRNRSVPLNNFLFTLLGRAEAKDLVSADTQERFYALHKTVERAKQMREMFIWLSLREEEAGPSSAAAFTSAAASSSSAAASSSFAASSSSAAASSSAAEGRVFSPKKPRVTTQALAKKVKEKVGFSPRKMDKARRALVLLKKI
ncbi:hypothetical protein ABVT39_025324 [Epinephelus coioides]